MPNTVRAEKLGASEAESNLRTPQGPPIATSSGAKSASASAIACSGFASPRSTDAPIGERVDPGTYELRGRPSTSYNLVRDRYDDLVPTVTLVELLYGFSSKPGLRAKGVGSAFIDARDELAKGPSRNEALIEEAVRDLGESLTIFGQLAADQVRRSWLRRKLHPLPPGLPPVPEDW